MPVMWPEQSPVSTRNTYSLLILTTFQREGLTYLSQVLFDSFCYVPASVWDEAQQALQLVDPELQRFGSPCLEGLPGPLYDQLFPRHLKLKKNTHQVQGPNVTQLIELTKVNSTQSYWMLQLELTVCQREGHRIQEHETELRTFTHIAQISATNKHFMDHWRNTVRRQLHTMLQRCE